MNERETLMADTVFEYLSGGITGGDCLVRNGRTESEIRKQANGAARALEKALRRREQLKPPERRLFD